MGDAMNETTPEPSAKRDWIGPSLLAALALLLFATIVPGVFTIDEPHYLSSLAALRAGRLTVPGTEGLPPSREVAWFDPEAAVRQIESTPIAPTVPPLWAAIALPFSPFGWRGLVALNIAAFVGATALIFHLTVRLSRSRTAGYWGAAAFALAGYQVEYAQGLWPQSLSVLLNLAALSLALAAVRRDSPVAAHAAGWLAGIATGVRYQNVVALALLPLVMLLFGRARIKLVAAYATAAIVPLVACSLANHQRLGSWNPISKGPTYISIEGGEGDTGVAASALRMTFARVVDYSSRPMGERTTWMKWVERGSGGALLIAGTVKKSWLQSAPWLALALAAAISLAKDGDRSARALFGLTTILLTVGLLGAFGVSGTRRDDGLGFNQRYLLDLVAPLAVCFGVALGALRASRATLLSGTLLGLLLASAALVLSPHSAAHQWIVRFLPLGLAAALVWAWWRGARAARLAALAAAALAWAFAIHVGTDLATSRQMRLGNRSRADFVRDNVPKGAAIVTWTGSKDFFGALLLDRSLTVVNAGNDQGETARLVVTALFDRGQRVFLWRQTMPRRSLERLIAGYEVRTAGIESGAPILQELRRPLAAAAQP